MVILRYNGPKFYLLHLFQGKNKDIEKGLKIRKNQIKINSM